jgi:hypothetical protein
MVNGWRFAFWRNRVMLALIAALLTLALILTFTPGVTVRDNPESAPENPVSEITP